MIYFFLLMALGFVLAKIGIFQKGSMPAFSALVVKVLLPCLQMSLVFERGTTFASFALQKRFVLMQLLAYLILTLLGILGARVFRIRFPQRNSFTGGMVGGNFGFLFIPLILSVFSDFQGYIPVMAAVDTCYVWTAGLLLYSQGCNHEGKGLTARTILKKLLNPMFAAILIALVLSTFHVALPKQVLNVITNVGSASGTLGMLLLGANICFMNGKMTGSVGKLLGFIGIRQILAPLLVFVISRPVLGSSEALLLMLLTGIPTMTTTSLLAIEYHTDVDFASNLVFGSTLSSLLTLPMIALVSTYL
ncbi:MAG: AEC family transporter [Clostridia bacterium]|nr:AEC family transporter [Clostridia bacterium]